jgi:hypothetical protein
MPIILATWEAEVGRIVARDPISTVARAKWTAGIA